MPNGGDPGNHVVFDYGDGEFSIKGEVNAGTRVSVRLPPAETRAAA